MFVFNVFFHSKSQTRLSFIFNIHEHYGFVKLWLCCSSKEKKRLKKDEKKCERKFLESWLVESPVLSLKMHVMMRLSDNGVMYRNVHHKNPIIEDHSC